MRSAADKEVESIFEFDHCAPGPDFKNRYALVLEANFLGAYGGTLIEVNMNNTIRAIFLACSTRKASAPW